VRARRQLLAVLAAGMVMPGRGWTQPAPGTKRIGILLITSRAHPGADRLVAPFLARMKALGYAEGRNLHIEWREADGRIERLPVLARELIALDVALIVAGASDAAAAARSVTATVPIVFVSANDPVQQGLVATLARPGGNATGLTGYAGPPGAKLLELLRDTSPRIKHVAVMHGAIGAASLPELRAAAHRLHMRMDLHEVRGEAGLDAALHSIVDEHADALVVLPDTTTYVHRQRIVQFAAQHRLPSIYGLAQFVDAGGLMSYAIHYADNWRRSADYVDKILKGAKPGDLPVQQPTQFDLVVNLSAARAIGFAIPKSILARANRVIE
jgi:putative tryptophan/tyrosine transport system substrate-binding protein